MKKSETSLLNIIEIMDARIQHLEDLETDNRTLLVKVVKQGNQIVSYLKAFEVEDITDEFENITSPPVSEQEKVRANKVQKLKEILDEFMERHEDLQEFEEELEKHKNELTPGTIGES